MAGTGAAANPLALVLKAIDEPLDLIEYNQWNVLLPEGDFLTQVGLLACRHVNIHLILVILVPLHIH